MASETDPLLDPQRDGSQRETESRCSRVVSALHYITTSTEIVIVAFMFYFAAFIPLLNQFIYSKVAQMMNYTGPLPNEMSANSSYECQHMNYSDPVYLAQQELQNKASLWSNLNTMVTLVPNFFSCIFLGGYSDLAGRKVAIVLPLIGALIKLAILIVISKAGLHVAYMFIGSFMDGVFGGTAVLITGCFSSIADITTNENRSFRIIILELCISVGVILSQILFGFIIKLLGYTWPFAILAALIFSLLIYVPLRVRETVTPSGPVPKCQSIYFTKAVLLYVRDPTKTRRRLKLIITILSVTILSGIFLGGNSVDTYRTMNSPFCWSSVMIGLFAGAKYTVAAVGTITLTKTLQPRLGDLRLVIFGCVSGAAYYIAFSFASKTWHLFAAIFLAIFSSVCIGLLRAYASKVVQPHEIGSLFASVAWAELLGALIGNVTLTTIYRVTLIPTMLNGLVFLVMALLYIIVIFLVTIALWSRGTETQTTQLIVNDSLDQSPSSVNA